MQSVRFKAPLARCPGPSQPRGPPEHGGSERASSLPGSWDDYFFSSTFTSYFFTFSTGLSL